MARGSQEFGSMDEFLGHKTRGSRGNFLKGWKKKGSIDTFMHTKRLPMAICRHSFPMYVVLEAKDTKEQIKHVFGKKFVCHESTEVLENPWRDKQTGELEKPPQRCGMHKFENWLWDRIVLWVESHSWDEKTKKWVEDEQGEGEGMDPCTLMFNFESEADNADEESIKLYAGGICGYFNQKELSDEVRSAMRKNKIRQKEVYKQNSRARWEYIMCVVDNNNPAAGCVIAVESEALGLKVKEVITKTIKSTKRNIQKNPYCIQWEYHHDQEFSKKYDATAMLDIKPSPRILKLINGEAPDLTPIKEPFNQQSMRMTLETHCLVKDIPWKEFFPTKKQEEKWASEDEAEEEENEKLVKSSKETDDEDDDADVDEDEEGDGDDDEAACDKCKKPIKMSDTKCPHCGFEYDTDDEEEEKPKKKSDKVTSKKTTTKKKPADDDDEDEDDEDEDEEEKPAPKEKTAKKVVKKSEPDEDEEEDDDEDEEEEEKPVPKKKVATKSKSKPKDDDEDEEDDEEEDDEDDDEEEDEKPAPKKKKLASKPKSKDEDEDDEEDDDDQDSEIPF